MVDSGSGVKNVQEQPGVILLEQRARKFKSYIRVLKRFPLCKHGTITPMRVKTAIV